MLAAGMDYTSVSRNLTFSDAITTQAVEIPIINDYLVEHSEIINLTLVSNDSAVILNPSTSTITIDVECELLYVYIYASTNQLFIHINHFSGYDRIQQDSLFCE